MSALAIAAIIFFILTPGQKKHKDKGDQLKQGHFGGEKVLSVGF